MASTTTTTSNSNSAGNKKRTRGHRQRSGLDVWLQSAGKNLVPGAAGAGAAGASLRIPLIVGSSLQTTRDPVDPNALPERFPAVLKFPVSTVPPDFYNKPWKDGRLYQQDIPKPPEDSDEEEDGEAGQKPKEKKKRWRYNNAAPRRQWILQEQVDFLETMVSRRSGGKQSQTQQQQQQSNSSKQKLSSRYEGIPEHNTSHFVLFQLTTTRNSAATATGSDEEEDDDGNEEDHEKDHRTFAISIRPVASSTIAFQQPAARATMTLNQAEQAIQDQRAGIKTTTKLGLPYGGGGVGGVTIRTVAPQAAAKNRLLHKLQQKMKTGPNGGDDGVEEADDVMGDVAYRSRKGGGGGGARRELLTSLGDGVTVSDDGVLGGTNDAAFGGKGQRFGQFHATEQQQQNQAGGASSERGADGAAMADDFYTRDVQAEYEAMDYDAAEQFDDDDVDLGEGEMMTDATGFGGEGEGDEEDDVEDDVEEEEIITGAAGLASRAVFKAMLAKARGEVVPDAAEMAAEAQRKRSNSRRSSQQDDEEQQPDHMAKIMAAADKAAHRHPGTTPTQRQPVSGEAANPAVPTAPPVATVDENGLRIITQEAVQREIWLNHGSIPVKRLSKIFDIGKKHGKERQEKLLSIVKELCTFRNDPVTGRMLVLKQHYSHMT